MPMDLKGASDALTHLTVADSFDFAKLTSEPTAPEGKPGLTVQFDTRGEPTGRTDGVFTVVLPSLPLSSTDDGLLLPAVQDAGLLLPAVQPDYGLLLPY
jgi:hypothetical protein